MLLPTVRRGSKIKRYCGGIVVITHPYYSWRETEPAHFPVDVWFMTEHHLDIIWKSLVTVDPVNSDKF